MKVPKNGEKKLFKLIPIFFSPSKHCANEAAPINKLRAEATNKNDFDKSLESLINLYTHQPETEYPDGKQKRKLFI